jgi:EAL domain-containing protein (putative c-di-GMP-specific phosphodiesterase class I)
VELTESVFALERKEISKITDILKASGIKILIDDFGTGYSSFARQRELNIDCIKIDKSFVDGIMKLEEEETITGDIISMVHKMGHCAIAEGVEHEKQMQYLKNNKCDKVQGYFISKPLDAEEAIEFLINYNKYSIGIEGKKGISE